AMMRFAIAINAENNSVGPAGVGDSGYRFSLPAIDLCEHGFHDWIAQLVLRIPPVERAQRFVDRIIRCFCLCDQTQRELMNEPRIGATIPGRINSLFAPLQKSLRIGECAFLFSVTGGREKENFSLDVLGLQFAA